MRKNLFFIALLVLTGCVQELTERMDIPSSVNSDIYEIIPVPTEGETSKSYYSDECSKITDLNIWVYYNDTGLLANGGEGYKTYFANQTSIRGSEIFPSSAREYDIYIYTNVGELTPPENRDEALNFSYTFENCDSFLTKGFPYAGHHTFSLSDPNADKSLTVFKTVAHYHITFKFPKELNYDFILNSAIVRDSPRIMHPFTESKTQIKDEVFKEGDKLSIDELLGKGGDIYILENIKENIFPEGAIRTQDELEHNDRNSTTYIEFNGEMDRRDGTGYSSITCRYYFGEGRNAVIKRNTFNNLTLQLTNSILDKDTWIVTPEEWYNNQKLTFTPAEIALEGNNQWKEFNIKAFSNETENQNIRYTLDYDTNILSDISGELQYLDNGTWTNYQGQTLQGNQSFRVKNSHALGEYIKLPVKGISESDNTEIGNFNIKAGIILEILWPDGKPEFVAQKKLFSVPKGFEVFSNYDDYSNLVADVVRKEEYDTETREFYEYYSGSNYNTKNIVLVYKESEYILEELKVELPQIKTDDICLEYFEENYKGTLTNNVKVTYTDKSGNELNLQDTFYEENFKKWLLPKIEYIEYSEQPKSLQNASILDFNCNDLFQTNHCTLKLKYPCPEYSTTNPNPYPFFKDKSITAFHIYPECTSLSESKGDTHEVFITALGNYSKYLQGMNGLDDGVPYPVLYKFNFIGSNEGSEMKTNYPDGLTIEIKKSSYIENISEFNKSNFSIYFDFIKNLTEKSGMSEIEVTDKNGNHVMTIQESGISNSFEAIDPMNILNTGKILKYGIINIPLKFDGVTYTVQFQTGINFLNCHYTDIISPIYALYILPSTPERQACKLICGSANFTVPELIETFNLPEDLVTVKLIGDSYYPSYFQDSERGKCNKLYKWNYGSDDYSDGIMMSYYRHYTTTTPPIMIPETLNYDISQYFSIGY